MSPTAKPMWWFPSPFPPVLPPIKAGRALGQSAPLHARESSCSTAGLSLAAPASRRRGIAGSLLEKWDSTQTLAGETPALPGGSVSGHAYSDSAFPRDTPLLIG